MTSKVQKENYVIIQGWMIKDLKLKGNELIIYAIVYGFSQTEGQVFNGSLQYLADWTNSTKQGVSKNLKSLVEKDYLQKKEKFINGVKFCEYYTTELNRVLNSVDGGMQQSLIGGMQQSLTNNISLNTIDNNIENNKDINYKAIVDRLNELAGTNFKSASKATRELIKARINEGFTEEDLITVVEKMCYLWNKEPKNNETDMRPYLRPATLFQASKFEGYLNRQVQQRKVTTKDLTIDISDF